ncbi:MAG: extracellular solute-binding protein [Lachnospiraceae bacterium]|nr:extracellular solute-binding protein [Lachnospiraceae bacterium]MCI9151044.1 extracellular solute-binding protein [Lachnospiraceae bacterium]
MCMGFLFLFSGCQSTGKGTEEAQKESAEEAGLEESQREDPVSLTLWGAEEDKELLAQMVESFQKEYASEAQLEISIAYQSESNCKDVLLDDPEGGADVFTFADDQLRALVAAGAVSPVENEEQVRSANVQGAWEAASVNGTTYAYPMTADNGYFLYYNKAYFTEEDIKSLDTILKAAKDAGKKVTMDWSSGWYLYSFFGCTDMTLGLNEDGVSNYCTWNATDTAIKGTDVAQALLDVAASSAFTSCTDTDFVEGVKDGKVIAGISGVWNATILREAWGEDYGAAKLPTYTCAGQQLQMASFAGYKMVGVNAYSKNEAWAQKLAAWITNEENQRLRFVQREQGPSNLNAANSPEVKASPAIQAVIMQSEFASLQYVGGEFWEPAQAFGNQMAAGNPQNEELQELLDAMVEGITLSYNQ